MGKVDREHERIYVADVYNDRVQIFDLDGNFIETWGEAGMEPGDLLAPSIALGGDGTICTGSETRPRITHFTIEGELISVIADSDDGIGFTFAMAVNSTGNLWAALWDTNVIHVFSADGELLGEIREIDGFGTLSGPSGLTFNEDGYLLVTFDGYGLVKLDVSGVFGG